MTDQSDSRFDDAERKLAWERARRNSPGQQYMPVSDRETLRRLNAAADPTSILDEIPDDVRAAERQRLIERIAATFYVPSELTGVSITWIEFDEAMDAVRATLVSTGDEIAKMGAKLAALGIDLNDEPPPLPGGLAAVDEWLRCVRRGRS